MSGQVSLYAVAAVGLVVVVTTAVGAWGLRVSRTTSDFMVASRSVSPMLNASAIGGEYLSAASFLGIAGLVMSYGADLLWYPVGFVAGYLVLLLLVAAPLRRSGAYTLPDFAEVRLGSGAVRAMASVLVVVIGWLYLLPQLQGAGLTLRTIADAPRWVGSLLVAVVVVGNVLAGGMRSITVVQAVQYWLKVTAIAVPAVVVVLLWRGGLPFDRPTPPAFAERTTVTVHTEVTVDVSVAATGTAHGVVDGVRRDGPVRLTPGGHTVAAGTTLTFPAGVTVPHVRAVPAVDDATWTAPLHAPGSTPHPLYGTYSLILATFLGTMGLPHVLVRFYTNPDGGSARRTTLLVLLLLGVFYLFPTVYGVVGRSAVPQLLMTGQTDAVVLVLPQAVVGGVWGQLLGALTAAGAFAAFLSASSGLVVSVAGVLTQDVLRGTVRSFRQATLVAGSVPLVLSLLTDGLPVSEVVGMAFTVAASSFCPLLLLGIWWRGLTAPGAVCGLLTGGGLAVAAVLIRIVGASPHGWPAALLAQPAAWTVPLAFVATVVGSRLTARHRPPGVDRLMLRLHGPEQLVLRTVPGASARGRCGCTARSSWCSGRCRGCRPGAGRGSPTLADGVGARPLVARA